jgi:molecular chaperone GrpE|tara:strand:- start:263 stop:817 length:555 start_codon:yes stop_codon:yes gene_type:complete
MSTDEIQNEEVKDQLVDQDTETTSEEAAQEAAVELSVEEQLTADLASEKDKFLRLFAEFENYKRRTSKERVELFKTASSSVMQAMLPVLDDLDRAWIEIEKSEDENLIKGIELISTKFKATLKEKGLEILEVRKGDVFNADFHEAITQIPAPTNDLKGKIIDVIEKGYKLGDKIIRFPKVVIGQ